MNSRSTLQIQATGAAVWLMMTISAHAQAIKPGLWETTNKMTGSPEVEQIATLLQQQLGSMPPEQRKMMEDMMAKKGMGVGGVSGNGITVKFCITKEMADRRQIPVQNQADCTQTISEQTSHGMKVKFACAQPPSSGEGHISFTGDSAYTMTMKINTVNRDKPYATTINGSGKWLNSDCGNIAPLAVPRQ